MYEMEQTGLGLWSHKKWPNRLFLLIWFWFDWEANICTNNIRQFLKNFSKNYASLCLVVCVSYWLWNFFIWRCQNVFPNFFYSSEFRVTYYRGSSHLVCETSLFETRDIRRASTYSTYMPCSVLSLVRLIRLASQREISIMRWETDPG